MKKTALAIVFALATTPFVFAAQTSSTSGKKGTSSSTVKKHKKGKKGSTATKGGTTSK